MKERILDAESAATQSHLKDGGSSGGSDYCGGVASGRGDPYGAGGFGFGFSGSSGYLESHGGGFGGGGSGKGNGICADHARTIRKLKRK